MKKIFLTIVIALSSFSLFGQIQQSYMIPDIGAPGMNVYIEIIGPTDSLNFFGTERVVTDNSLVLKPSNSADIGKIDFSPLYVSWSGRLISAQIFVHPDLKPTSWKWNEGICIPLNLFRSGIYIGTYNFYVVQPFHIGDVGADRGLEFGTGGDAGLGLRSPRGAMIIDSMISTESSVYTVSKIDCDPNTPGNQAYLPFILISIGRFEVPRISVNANGKDGGVGGGGGGGCIEDEIRLFGKGDVSLERYKGGDGFTGGGIGAINYSIQSTGEKSSRGGGIGSGSMDSSKARNYAGYSLNGVKGAKTILNIWESAAGGTGHPFGTSGSEYQINDNNNFGGVGGGSGAGQNTVGGNGSYANSTGERNAGSIHGNEAIVPLAGGSGGSSGNPQAVAVDIRSGYGGGGGGAISISAPMIKIKKITANGAKGGDFSTSVSLNHRSNGGHGSGGAIILNGRVTDYTVSQIDTIETSDGGRTLSNAGYARVSGIMKSIGTMNAVHYAAISSDNIKYIDPKKAVVHKGKGSNINTNGNIIIVYYKSENATDWKELTRNIGVSDTWEYTIDPNFWEQSTDTVYYFYAVQNNDAPYFVANPKNILSQSAANVIILRSPPAVEIPDDLVPKDTMRMDLGKLMACQEGYKLEPFKAPENEPTDLLKVDLYGVNIDNFSVSVIPQPPASLSPGESIQLQISFNVGANKDTSLGMKEAYLDMYLFKNGEYVLIRYLLYYSVVKAFEDKSLDIGVVSINDTKEAILTIRYLPTVTDVLTKAWLIHNTYFTLENASALTGSALFNGKVVNANISCNTTVVGWHYDTLCLLIDNDVCTDTTFVPIKMYVEGETYREFDIVDLSTIAICGDEFSVPFTIPVKTSEYGDFTGDVLTSVSSFTYSNSDVVAVLDIPTAFPYIFDEQVCNSVVTVKSIGKEIGYREAMVTFYIQRKNGNMFEQTIIYPIEVIIPVSISPLNIDYGIIASPPESEVVLANIHLKDWEIYSSRFVKGKYTFTKNFSSVVPNLNSDTARFIFLSSVDGSFDDSLEVVIKYPDCYDTLWVRITGDKKQMNNFILEISKHKDVSPKETNFPVSVSIESNVNFSGGRIDTMFVHFDRGYSLFFPRRIDNNSTAKLTSLVLGEQRLLTITDITVPSLIANEKKLLLNIVGDVMLGSTDSTGISFYYPTIFNSFAEAGNVIEIAGSLKLEICEAGGNRLVEIKSSMETHSVNPITTNSVEVKCMVNVVDNYYLEVVDNAGNSNLLLEWNVSNLDTKEYTFDIDLTKFANGNYYLRLRNSTDQYLMKLILAR